MATVGSVFLIVAFSAAVAAVVLFLAGWLSRRGGLSRIGHGAVLVTFAALLVCCGVLVVCFRPVTQDGDIVIMCA